MANNFKERERIIFLHDIPAGFDNDEDKAKQISKEYPQLIVFSNPESLSTIGDIGSYSDSNLYNPDGSEFYKGAHIYKNGIRYSLVRGICPGRNSIMINDTVIELQLDKLGLLRLMSYPEDSGYFYVGPYNPFNKYLITTNQNNVYECNESTFHYDSYRQVLTNVFDIQNDISGFTRLMPIKGYDTESKNSHNQYNAYILCPQKWLSSLYVSNDLGVHEVTNNINQISSIQLKMDQVDANDNSTTSIIKIENVNYVVFKTRATCDAIRIYYKS